MILEKDYGVWYWLHVDLTPHEFQTFIENLKQVNEKHGVEIVDSWDEEEQDICFRFSQCRPTKVQEIKLCKARNEKNCKKFMQLLSKKIDGRLYFNVNHKVIKKK